MDISEWLDDECDVKATLNENSEIELGSVLVISLEDENKTQIRIYPKGIKRLLNLLEFAYKNNLVLDDS